MVKEVSLPPVFNLFSALPAVGAEESFQTLCEGLGARIERIVSYRHASPPGFWYDQAHAEWVVLLQGEAVLGFADAPDVALKAGDSLLIPAHRRHRVVSTGEGTVWLAVHFREQQPET